MHYQAVDYQQGVSNAWSNVATFVPKFFVFLIILVVGYLIAKAVEKILDKVLQRAGFDGLVERGGVKKALAKSKYDAASILGKLVFYAIMLFVLSTAFGVFGPNPLSDYLHSIVAYLPKVFIAILIVIVTMAIAAAVKTLIESSLGGLSYGKTVANLASVFIVALGVIAALDQLQIAKNVVNALLYAVLAAAVGVIVVAVGGGGIVPMRSRWEATLDRYDQEKPNIAAAAKQANPAADLKAKAAQAKAAGPQARPAAVPVDGPQH